MLSDKEIISLLATELMGWKRDRYSYCVGESTWAWFDDYSYVTSVEGWDPLAIISDARMLETKIADLGLREAYINALRDILDPNGHVSIFESAIEVDSFCGDKNGYDVLWSFTRANAKQRSYAALKAKGIDLDTE